MKINDLKINSYGKLKNKDITLKDGINVIYGENEKGKSTLLNSIVNLLYGTSKNKKGKDISDYDKFKPWDSEEFSGKISYTLDNNDSFEVFREFGKKTPKIYDKNMEEISKNFSIDKTAGSQFFAEQTGVDEATFTSTVVSFQNAVEIDTQTQNVLLQRIANTSSTGDEGISYKKAIEKLSKKQLDEIGTSRSQGKPINVITNEIRELTATNEELSRFESLKYDIEDRKSKIEDEISKVESKSQFLNKLNSINQSKSVEEGKLKYNENKIDELEDKIQKLMQEKEKINKEYKNISKSKKEKVNTIPYIIGILISVILSICLYVVTKKSFAFIPLIFGVICLVLLFAKIRKINGYNQKRSKEQEEILNYNKEIEKKIYEIDAQMQLLETSQKDQIQEAESIKNEIMKGLDERLNSLKSEYSNKIDSSSMNYFISQKDIENEISQNNRIMNDKNLELHRLNLDKENILPKLEEYASNEEKISADKEVYANLLKKNDAIEMAKEIIESSYQKMKNDVAPRFTENLSKNIALITNNKYKRIVINESDGILVELENGEYKNANLLSKGTIEQLYLAFRLSIIEDISEESMPIIFDEIFAYFDDNRLRETLRNLENNYSKKHQIILFTCTKREEEALNDLNIDYNLINL
ncbi:MAG: AAA family ATPase [Clostridia bacterium]|nr:AAA family ATPase [Clostridia bacterium]